MVYSFTSDQVEEIKDQHLKLNIDREPYFFSFKLEEIIQTVRIYIVDRGAPDFTAVLKYLTSESGGKTSFARSGYRPAIRFDGRKELTSGEQLFVNQEKVFPGDVVNAEIRIVGKDFFINCLYPGQKFQFFEGSHCIGSGQITNIVNKSLERANKL